MRIPLDQLEVVVKPGDGDSPGGPPGTPGGGGGVHIVPVDKKGKDSKEQQGGKDGTPGGEGGESGGEQSRDDAGSASKSSGDIRKINGAIQAHDEMIDGDQDWDVLEGSDMSNDSSTELEETDKLKSQAREHLRQIMDKVGTGNASKAPLIDTIDIDKKDYKVVLRELFSLARPSKSRSYAKGDRRSAYRTFSDPGKIKKKELNSFMLALDTSGSITPEMISKFIGTAQRIGQEYANDQFTIRIVLYVQKVYKVKDFRGNEVKKDSFPKWLKQNIDTQGGNYFSTVAKHISNMKDIANFKGIIYLTDGEEAYDKFTLPPIKNIFLIDGKDLDLADMNRSSSRFLKYVQKQTPGGKKVDIYQINI